jgi:adenylate cyclase
MKPSILIVDDEPELVEILERVLTKNGFDTQGCSSATEALDLMAESLPTVVISDVHMPKMTGYDLCREIRVRYPNKIVPVILVTGGAVLERVRGLESGADEFLTKPVDTHELLVRVRSLVRIRELHDTVTKQADQLQLWGKELESRVATQVQQLGQLKSFFSPQVADLVSAIDGRGLVKTHRKEVTILFVDLRGFTAFTETSQPDVVMAVLADYYSAVGHQGLAFGGTLGRFMGDGGMIFFNDPNEIPGHQQIAVRAALAIRQSLAGLKKKWAGLGYQLDAGIGIATGTETIGVMGFDRYVDYSIIGPATNLASRLCDEAKGGEILVSDYLFKTFLTPHFTSRVVGTRAFKGIHQDVIVHTVLDEASPAQKAG